MPDGSPRRVVALDGGTTNTRARLLVDGQVVATARRSVGVRDTVLTSGRAATLSVAVADAVGEVLRSAGQESADAVVAAGMLSSEVGLAAVPHVAAPAGLEDLARGAARFEVEGIPGGPILFVPGVRTPPGEGPDGWAEADVMRGEECETFGALRLLDRQGPVAFLWPGSHTKLVEVDEAGRIARSLTTIAGELTSAVARNTLLAASLPKEFSANPDPATASAGARVAAERGLGRAAFLVRVAALTGVLTEEQRAAFWVGAVIGDDVTHLAGATMLGRVGRLIVGGRQPQRGLYADLVRGLRSLPVEELSDEAAEVCSAAGALAVLERWSS
jgi:2-dehydro-3-deoxygalactonokinase